MQKGQLVDERVRAHHEAGHAVAAYRFGVPMVNIHIISSDERQGGVEYVPFDWTQPPCAAIWREMLHRAVIRLAGLEGQAATLEERPRRVVDMPDSYWDNTKENYDEARIHGAAGDFVDAAQDWVRYVWAQRKQVQRYLIAPDILFRCVRKRAFALFILEENRDAVRVLAGALLHEKTLTGLRAVKIIENALAQSRGKVEEG